MPAFCTHTCALGESASPDTGPNTAVAVTMGTSNWLSDTPRFPSPPLRPSARPFCRAGKKKEMLLTDDAKAPPPTPLPPASSTRLVKLQSLSESTMKVPNIGNIAIIEFMVLCIRVPQIATMKLFTTRRVAPTRPAIAGNVDVAILYCLSSAWVGFK